MGSSGSLEDSVGSSSQEDGYSRRAFLKVAVPVVALAAAAVFGLPSLLSYLSKRDAVPVVQQTPSQQTQAPLPTQAPVQTPIPGLEKILSDEQIKAYVTEFAPKQPITQAVLDKVNAVNASLYYRFTGKTFEQVKFVPMLLSGVEYKKLQDAGKISKISAGTIGFGPNRETFLYANVDSPNVKGGGGGPLEVLNILAHETGQAEAYRILDKALKELHVTTMSPYFDAAEQLGLTGLTGDIKNPKIHLSAVTIESLQILYNASVVHYLEELGLNMGGPASAEEYIDATVDGMINSSHFYPQASTLDWVRAFEREDTRESLEKTGRITSQQAWSLFNHYIQKLTTSEGIKETVVEIANSVKSAPNYAQRIKDAAHLSKRTVPIFP